MGDIASKIISYAVSLMPMKIMRYHYYRIEKFVESIAKNNSFDAKKILDIGSENQPYKHYFPEKSYFSQDIAQNKQGTIDFIGDLNKGVSSIDNNSFDYILCTQVLEHIYDPKKAFEEFHRILKPGGILFLTTHMVFDEHMEPYDYFRFTKFGLRSLGEQAGFKVEKIVPQGGVFQVLAYIITYIPIKLFLKRDSLGYYLYLILFFPLIFAINLICYSLDKLDKDKTLTINYECTYQKA